MQTIIQILSLFVLRENSADLCGVWILRESAAVARVSNEGESRQSNSLALGTKQLTVQDFRGDILREIGKKKMSQPVLTVDALPRMIQVLGVKELPASAGPGGTKKRFRLLLNDGQYNNSFVVLAEKFSHLVLKNEIIQHTVIKVTKRVSENWELARR